MAEQKQKKASPGGIAVAFVIGLMLSLGNIILLGDLQGHDVVQLRSFGFDGYVTLMHMVNLACVVVPLGVTIWVCFFRRRGLGIIFVIGIGASMVGAMVGSGVYSSKIGLAISEHGAIPQEKVIEEVGFPVKGLGNVYYYVKGEGDREAKLQAAFEKLSAEMASESAADTQPAIETQPAAEAQ